MSESTKRCVACEKDLTFLTTKSFHTGAGDGDFLERLPLAMYACPACGRVELFLQSAAPPE